jgi:hypothetical protein
LNGPFPCGEFPDLKIGRKDYIHRIDEGEMIFADEITIILSIHMDFQNLPQLKNKLWQDMKP